MKASIIAVLATATLATASAIPSCARTDVDSFSERDLNMICLNICWTEKHKCTTPRWFPVKRSAKCWTCCKRLPPHHPPHGFEFEEEEFEGVDGFDGLD